MICQTPNTNRIKWKIFDICWYFKDITSTLLNIIPTYNKNMFYPFSKYISVMYSISPTFPILVCSVSMILMVHSLQHGTEQAQKIKQESGTPMWRIMSGSQCGGLCEVEVSLTILKMEDIHRHTPPPHRSEYRVHPGLKKV